MKARETALLHITIRKVKRAAIILSAAATVRLPLRQRGSVFRPVFVSWSVKAPWRVLSNGERSPHDFSEPEMWNAIGEAFRVDDLLDFSNDDIGAPIGDEEGNTSDSAEASESTERNYYEETHKNEEPLASELCVPTDALAELEWLSSFVEDSFSTVGLTELPPCYGGLIPSVNDNKDSKEDMKLNNQCQTSPFGTNRCKIGAEKLIPGRARSKRSRTGGRVWSFNSSRLGGPSFESQSPVFVSAFSVNDNSSDSSSSASFRPVKKPKGNHAKKTLEGSQPRRCSHCLVQKTPQWRAGPMGPKTLCNACGVRFKSGRLLPEYRPAMSPTFLSEVHSNSHRKVLEMRRQKEQQMTSENHGFVTSFTQEGVLV